MLVPLTILMSTSGVFPNSLISSCSRTHKTTSTRCCRIPSKYSQVFYTHPVIHIFSRGLTYWICQTLIPDAKYYAWDPPSVCRNSHIYIYTEALSLHTSWLLLMVMQCMYTIWWLKCDMGSVVYFAILMLLLLLAASPGN